MKALPHVGALLPHLSIPMRLTCQVAYRPGLSDPGHSPIPKEPSTTEARWALDLAGPCSYTLCRGASDDSPIGRSHCLTKICFRTLHQTTATQSVSTSATRSPLCSGSFAQRREAAIMRSLRQIFRFNVAFGDVSQIASGSHIIWVDLLPPLYLHKSSGKVVLDRSEAVTSCLRE